MFADIAKLGLKNLGHRRLRSWLTMIGIFIGIATVVSLIALGAGLRDAITAQFSALGTDKLIISAKGNSFGPPGQDAAAELTKDDLAVVQRSRYVSIATARLITAVSVEFNDKTKPEFIGSLPQNDNERKLVIGVINANPIEGRWIKATDGYRVVLGNDFTNPDQFGKQISVGDNLLINGKKVQVVGILEKKGSPQYDASIYMNENELREIVNQSKEYSAIIAQVSKTSDLPLAQQTIEKNLRSFRHVKEGKEDFSVQTPDDVLQSFNTILTAVTAVLVGIAGISLVVGGIGIMNTMYTAVLERTREIGIMKAVGARNSDILTLFLFESGLLGLSGAAIGVALGWILSKGVALIGSLALGSSLIQAQVSPGLIFASLAFGFLVGSLAGAFPAYEASKLPPVEALYG